MKSTLLAFTAVLLAALPASADPHGVFVLYEGNAAANSRPVARTGCDILRQGTVVARQGNLDLPDGDRFAMLRCADAGTRGQDVFQAPSTINPWLSLEGRLSFFEELAQGDAVEGRQYILKISHYNNQDPAGRNADLEHLGKVVEPVADKYHNEMFLEVHRASGMQTPDEVVAIYYDTPEAGDRFREKNQAILEKIGAFNKKHLKSFTYLVAQPD